MGTLIGNATGTLQTVDFSYHIRGLRGINLDASGNLTNKLFSMKLGYEETGYYDGNIGKQEWKSSIDNLSRTYTYRYDGASRIKAGVYSGGKPNENYSLNNVTYDDNGNIKNLIRTGLKTNNTFGIVDNLVYTYQANSNKIQAVADNSGENSSFTDATGSIDCTYYPDGSLKSDANKGISLIEYNYLKLPKKITKGSTIILNEYDASGTKLKETIGTQVTDYVGNKIYRNGSLYQISHGEGRIINGEYEYNIKDHLGNLRVAFRDSSGIAKVVQANSYGVWGEDLPTLSYLKPLWKVDKFKFTGKEELQGTGYIDFGARLYDNLVPRFTTLDPLCEISRRFSPTVYANNNPIRFIDPDGMWPGEGLWEKVKTIVNKVNNFIDKKVSGYQKNEIEVTGGYRGAAEYSKGTGVDVNAASIRLVKAEYHKDSKDGVVAKGVDYLSKTNEKGKPTATISHGGEIGAEYGLEVKKEYQVDSNLKSVSDNTNEVTVGASTGIPTLGVILKYESNEKTGDRSIQIGVSSALKIGYGVVLDANFMELGIKIRLPK